ncbi:ATP-dependent zinc metalloprotease FtsH [Patescibacteria group bacterium]|nr:ATP-dependent zinc metalloprotease FtsH [Patescibacteria group bacterium]MBU1931520.1 ATP-dependent zinc metalloprotease FtsH [Patescibacteria group bacterium]
MVVLKPKPAVKSPIKKVQLKFKFNLKRIFLWSLIIFLLLPFFFSLGEVLPETNMPLSEVLRDIKSGQVERVEVANDELMIFYQDDRVALSLTSGTEAFETVLEKAGIDPTEIEFSYKDQSMIKAWAGILEVFGPIILMGVLMLFLFRQARGAQDSIFSFGKSKAKLFAKGKQDTTFKDVAGVDEAKKELEEVVDFLKHPKKYQALGARTPKGVILIGPSGCGKTLLAKAVAGEASVPFFSMAGSEFMEMLVGVGASRVRDLFKTAKKSAPAIIFIDEVDAIGRTRSVGVSGGHDEREQTLNQILVEMDGFNPNDQVVVVAATNRGDLLDPALVRPGRFDRRIILDLPDIAGRKAILNIHKKGKPFVQTVEWEKVAKRTVGFSGADIENMLNEAAISAARENKTVIGSEEIEEAALKVKLGPEKKRKQTKDDLKMTAYHEAGHAVVTHFLPQMDLVHRVSIVSRGMTLGYTLIPPKTDRYTETRSHLLARIVSLFGGRAAEELIFNELTGGAANDISQATDIARRMVVNLGMSNLGPINYGDRTSVQGLSSLWYEPVQVSPDMQAKVDQEVKKIIDKAYQQALEILKKNTPKLDKVAEVLLEKETVEGDEFESLMKA